MRDEAGVCAMFQHRRRAGLRPFANHLPKVHVPPVKRHLLRRSALRVFIRIPQLDRRVDVKHAFVVAPLQKFAAVNVPREVNQHIAGGKIFAQQRAHVLARHAPALELHAALEPRRQDAAPVLEVHDGDVFGRGLDVLDQDRQGALRDGAVADEQDFVFKLQHGKIILARHFVRKYLVIQGFIEERRFVASSSFSFSSSSSKIYLQKLRTRTMDEEENQLTAPPPSLAGLAKVRLGRCRQISGG